MRILNILAVTAILFGTASTAGAQPDANARVQKACATGSHDACMAQIHLEEACAQYRGTALVAFGYMVARAPIGEATQSMLKMQTRMPAFADEPVYLSLISDAAVINLLHAAYNGPWIVDQDFARAAYKRCLSGKPF